MASEILLKPVGAAPGYAIAAALAIAGGEFTTAL